MANEALDKFVKDNQQFIKINDGDTFKGVYAGYKVYPNRFSPGKETVGYFFITVDSDGDKSEKAIPWECGRVDVAIIMKKFKDLMIIS